MPDGANESASGLTKGARITGDQRSSLGTTFGERYAGGESIRSIASDTGRSYGFVHGVLKESGATLRGRGGATRGPRRGAAGKLGDQATSPATDQPAASAVRTKAKAAKDKVAEKVADKTAKAAKAAKDTKDDKAKKKAEPKKSGKKGKKG
jgi:hypothetical protein